MTGVFRSMLLRRWKALSIVLTVMLLLTLGFYALWNYINPVSAPNSVALSWPVKLSLELEKTEFRQDEIIVVRVWLQNMGDQNITLRFNCYVDYAFGIFGFLVKDENGTIVHKEGVPLSCVMSAKSVPLQAGNKTECTFQWTQRGSLLPANRTTGISPPVPLGTYRITAATLPFDVANISIFWLKLVTPPITIDITQ